jgi:phosphoribosylanthranilate isomerase
MRIKVCGLNDERNILEVASLIPDYMGFIFYEKSPRYAGKLNKKILWEISSDILKTAVFVNASIDDIMSITDTFEFDCIQLHGNEDPDFCEQLRFVMPSIQIVKAVSISSEDDMSLANIFEDVCDFILFDTKTENYGGSGIKFNHSLLSLYSGSLPFFLGGGLGPDDMESIRLHEKEYNKMFGADLNSRFELSAGVKNIPLLKNAIATLRNLQ